MNPLVSYIVPVYNAEKFLLRTLNALAGQTYKNIEVILVDDGSSDSSGSICDDFCSADSRFKCIHIKNGGVSHARNTGLENADGDYIMFGKESAGIPEEILMDNRDTCIRIPMMPAQRSLNLSNSVAVVLYEALRQNQYLDLELKGELHHHSWDEM